MMNVTLFSHTKEPEKIVAAAAKLCYSDSKIKNLLDNLTIENIEKMILKLNDLGHESPLEHASFSFGIEGVSRALTHQLVRHRVASYSQQSQRYVKLEAFEYVMPPEIKGDAIAEVLFLETMSKAQQAYDGIVFRLKSRYIEKGMKDKNAEKKAIEDARYVFPNACETKIIVTMNARELLHFFRERCCNRAQWEIRQMAWLMLKECKRMSPNLFRLAGPICAYKSCKEGKMSCGEPFRVKTRSSFNEFWETE